MRRQIVVSVDGLPEGGVERLKKIAGNAGASIHFVPESEGWDEKLAEAEVAIGMPPPALVERSLLRYVQLHSSGFDPYKTPALLNHASLQIANARGVTAQAVAEQCLAMMFALTRRIPFQLRNQLQHVWRRAASYDVLFGETITIVGMGAIGSALGRMCKGIGMRVHSVQRRTEMPAFVDRVFPLHEMSAALDGSRHLALALPTISLVRPLVGDAELAAMPHGSYVYSMSRAPLLDYDALVRALDTGQLAGAGLDVFPAEPLPADNRLWDREDVLIAPHSGGRFRGEMAALAQLFGDNLERYFSGQPLVNVVISKDTPVD